MSEKFLGTEEDELRARIDVLEGTVEMLGRRNTRLLSVVQLVHDALAAEKWDGRWSNRLMQARQVAHGMLADASVPLGQHLTPNDRLAFDATSGEPIGEIVMRLREELAWEPEVADLMSQAADELERLLWRSKVNENIVARFQEDAHEIENLRELRKLDGESIGKCLEEYNTMKELCIDGKYLTDAEREAIELSISKRLDLDAIYTLRKLLERMK